jgi:hypothetical protein
MVCQATALLHEARGTTQSSIGGRILAETTKSSYPLVAHSQVSWENGHIEPFIRQQTAEEILAQLRAEAELAELDVAEELAQIHDEEKIPTIRTILANRYRGLVGIEPNQRDILRQALLTPSDQLN